MSQFLTVKRRFGELVGRRASNMLHGQSRYVHFMHVHNMNILEAWQGRNCTIAKETREILFQNAEAISGEKLHTQ
jgi:hypothetical protein